jgi:hypothetical protein
MGIGMTFNMPDGTGTDTEQMGSIDVEQTDITAATNDSDIVLSQVTAGTVRETLRTVANSSTTTGDSLKFTSNTTETNGILTNPIFHLVVEESAGEGASGIGGSIRVDLDGAAAGNEEAVGIDFTLTDGGDGTEDADVVFSQMSAGTVAETLRLVTASSATAGDSILFSTNTTETDGIIDVLELQTAGPTAATGGGLGLGVTFSIPDDGDATVNQNASIDVVQTSGADGAEDTDFVFSHMTAGTETETLRLVADAAGTTTGDRLQFTSLSAETNGVVNTIESKLSGGTVLVDFGNAISLQAEFADGVEEACSMAAVWTDVATGTEDADMVFYCKDAGGNDGARGVEIVRLTSDGEVVMMVQGVLRL